jgi:hemerythrin
VHKWNAKTDSVGITKMDDQHKVLLGLANSITEFDQGDSEDNEIIGRILNTLAEYTKTHFVEEERMMKKMGYPLIDEHIRLHNSFIQKVEKFISLRQEDVNKVSVQMLAEFLTNWIEHHIRNADKKYSDFLLG